MTVRWGVAGPGLDLVYVATPHPHHRALALADTVAVQDVLAEIACQLGIRVIEGAAELP